VQSHHKTRLTRRCLAQGLVIGLLITWLVPEIPAQEATPRPTANETVDNEKVVMLEPYTVIGSFAGSLAAAAEKKESNQAIAEVITSEDIGKLLDVSIADSLARLTGVTTQRQNGRSQAVSIRGLTGDFSTGMLNGREQVSTGENRAVEFDQYPAELLSEVIVYKTAAADLTSQGLAGTVDLRTVRPLSQRGRTVAMNGYYEWTQYKRLTPGIKAAGDRFDFSYVDQNADHTVGIAIGYSHSDKPYRGKQFGIWGYNQDENGAYALGGFHSYVRNSNLKRDGLMAVLEFKPNDNIHSTIDLYTSKFEEKEYAGGLEIPLYYIFGPTQIQPGYTVTNGLITQMTLTNVQPVVHNDFFKRNDSPLALGWNLQLGGKSAWPVTFDAGYSKVKRTDMYLESYSGLGFAWGAPTPDTLSVHLIPGQLPVIKTMVDYTDTSLFSVTDPLGWQTWMSPIGGPGWLKYLHSKDELGQFKLWTDHAMKSLVHDVELGVSYTDRYKSDGEGPSGLPVNASGQALAPLPAITGTTDMSFLGIGRIYAYDPVALFDGGSLIIVPDPYSDFVAQRFQVEEKIAQFYAQFNLDHKLGSIPVTGNVGLRVIGADQSSRGYSSDGFNLTPVSGRARYRDFAPSLNLNFTVGDHTYVRFGAARQLARPRMYDMRVGRNWSYDPSLASSTDLNHSPWAAWAGGNAGLRPWRANSLDLSFEKYFADNKGYFAVAAFTKQLLNLIYTQQQLMDFTGYPVEGPVAPALRQGIVSSPANGTGGSIRGFEATLSLASEMISGNLKGFGVIAGGAYTDSNIAPWGPGNGDIPLAGLSRKVANITLYFERHGFSARISERYRSISREYILQFNGPNRAGDVGPNYDFSVAQPERVVDAQVSYTLQAGSAKGLTFFLQVYNLNNEPVKTYQNNDPRLVENYQTYGASYSAGASYKF
jgi:iron complex outermembrane receptor protein